MEITKEKYLKENYKMVVIPIILSLVGLFSFYIGDWIGLSIWFGFVVFVEILLYDSNILIPLFILTICLTAQVPDSFQNITSYVPTLLLLIYWIVFKIFTKESFPQIDKNILYLLLFYFFWNIVSSFFSFYTINGFFVTLRIIVFFLIIYILYDWARNLIRIHILIKTIVVVGCIASLATLHQFYSNGFSFLTKNMEVIRYSGLFSGQNALGLVLSFSIPLNWFLIYQFPQKRLSLLFISFLMIFALILTGSRSASLSVFISSIFIFSHYKFTRKIILFFVSLFIFSLILLPKLYTLIYAILRLQSGVSYRDILWKSAIRMMNDFPIFGIGPASIKYYMLKYSGLAPNTWLGGMIHFSRGDAHNLFLTSGAELGVIGMLIAFSIFILYLLAYLKSKNTDQKTLLIVCGGIVCGTFVRAFFEGNGIITKGYLSFDIYFWIVFIITLRLGIFSNVGKKL